MLMLKYCAAFLKKKSRADAAGRLFIAGGRGYTLKRG